ncbi:MAG: hypothetical protein JRN15_11100 [Nitrososphaerota archaeon]|nr:hypothetical protein [Nitrososphaerota archaeon]
MDWPNIVPLSGTGGGAGSGSSWRVNKMENCDLTIILYNQKMDKLIENYLMGEPRTF